MTFLAYLRFRITQVLVFLLEIPLQLFVYWWLWDFQHWKAMHEWRMRVALDNEPESPWKAPRYPEPRRQRSAIYVLPFWFFIVPLLVVISIAALTVGIPAK